MTDQTLVVVVVVVWLRDTCPHVQGRVASAVAASKLVASGLVCCMVHAGGAQALVLWELRWWLPLLLVERQCTKPALLLLLLLHRDRRTALAALALELLPAAMRCSPVVCLWMSAVQHSPLGSPAACMRHARHVSTEHTRQQYKYEACVPCMRALHAAVASSTPQAA